MTGHYMIASGTRGVEGDVASLKSQVVTVGLGHCLSLDLYLVFSRPSSENALTVLGWKEGFYPQILHQFVEWNHDTWWPVEIPLHAGHYTINIAFTMGFPYQCDAAVDNIQIRPCRQTTVHIKDQEGDYYLFINSLAPGWFDWNFRHVIFKQSLVIDGWCISCEIALIWMSLDFTDH